MRNRGQVLIGGLIVVVGLVFLIGALLDVDVGTLCWPIGLIVLGVWVLLRPRQIGPETAFHQKLLGDIRRDGVWQVANEEVWIGVGDVRLDMTLAEIPQGETKLRVIGFAGKVVLTVPEDVAVALSSTAFLTQAKVPGEKREQFLIPVEMTSGDYEASERKIRLETTFFVGEIRVRRS